MQTNFLMYFMQFICLTKIENKLFLFIFHNVSMNETIALKHSMLAIILFAKINRVMRIYGQHSVVLDYILMTSDQWLFPMYSLDSTVSINWWSITLFILYLEYGDIVRNYKVDPSPKRLPYFSCKGSICVMTHTSNLSCWIICSHNLCLMHKRDPEKRWRSCT